MRCNNQTYKVAVTCCWCVLVLILVAELNADGVVIL